MTGIDLIAEMRSRLRDPNAQWWSDGELLSAINSAITAVAIKLKPWKNRWVGESDKGVDTYSIPDDFMAPISLLYNNEIIEIKGIDWALSHDVDGTVAFIDDQSLIIYPMPDGIYPIVLNYEANRQIKTKEEVIRISTEMENTVLYYALSLAYQKPASEESLTQSRFFLQLYKDHCNDISKISSDRKSSRSTRSRYQRV